MSAAVPILELELSHLDLRYRSLRISEAQGVTRLVASLGAEGQAAPVLVIQPAGAPIAGETLRCHVRDRIEADTDRVRHGLLSNQPPLAILARVLVKRQAERSGNAPMPTLASVRL